ncbi:MAG: TonB-dependent receptor [Ideonella sp.]
MSSASTLNNPIRGSNHRLRWFALLICSAPLMALAQTGAAAADARSPALEPAAAAASAPRSQTPLRRPSDATPPSTTLQRVQITGSTSTDETQQRRQSTAAKIIVGREEIERFGDDNVADVLKRLPGVTTGGAPGRRGGPRMRGLSGGYTQLLINGEPIPTGFSLESLTPEQVERIEILRAPTAEYGARAIAGTINIVLREALQKRINDLRIGTGIERGRASPNVSWTRNDKLGDADSGDVYNLSVSAFRRSRADTIDNRTTTSRIDSGAILLEQDETGQDSDHRIGMNASARLQWRLGGGSSFSLQPFVFTSSSDSQGHRHLEQPIGSTLPPYADADLDSESRYTVARINAQWQQRLGSSSRLDLRLGTGGFDSHSSSRRLESDAAGSLQRRLDDTSSIKERSLTSIGKLSHELASEHSLVSGWDVQLIRREEQRSSLQNGIELLGNYNNEVNASSQRVAFYTQDEWNPSRQWSAYAGLRWEQIATRSEASSNPISQRSAVWTPLLQAVWKPEEKSRDQIRMALTRSYKSPTLRNLIARPSISTRENSPTSPDTVGNPMLRPELATGIDLAYEHYLPAGGLFSVNLFQRRISNLIRTVIDQEVVPWSAPGQTRWVARPQNFGKALTQGIELEAKGRLNEWVADWPAVAVRSNLSVFRSRVDGVPGPDNRLDEQPSATANLGADYRFRSAPLTMGGNLNWTPSYVVQQTVSQQRSSTTKRTFEAFATWAFNPAMSLRVAANDLAPLDYTTLSSYDVGNLRDSRTNRSHTRTQWNVRLELKL